MIWSRIKDEQRARVGVEWEEKKIKCIVKENWINDKLMSINIKEWINYEEYTVGYSPNEDANKEEKNYFFKEKMDRSKSNWVLNDA